MPSPHQPNLQPYLTSDPRSLIYQPPKPRDPIDVLIDEVRGLKEEVQAMRSDHRQLSTVLVTGQEAMAEFKRLSSQLSYRLTRF